MSNQNLHLSVINNGDVYQERLKIARHTVGNFSNAEHVKQLRPIVLAQATAERKEFGSKFTQADITAACVAVAEYDKQALLDDMRANVAAGGEIFAQGRKWFDSVNGNTYHSVRMTVGGYGVYLPMQYGYGEQWKYTARDWLIENKIVPNPGKYDSCESNPFTHKITFSGGEYGLKREL